MPTPQLNGISQTPPVQGGGNSDNGPVPMEIVMEGPFDTPRSLSTRPPGSNVFAESNRHDPFNGSNDDFPEFGARGGPSPSPFANGPSPSPSGPNGPTPTIDSDYENKLAQLNELADKQLGETIKMEMENMQRVHTQKLVEGQLQTLRNLTNMVEKFSNDMAEDAMNKAQQSHDSKSSAASA